MTMFQLLKELKSKGIRVRQENGELKFQAPKGTMNDSLRALLLTHKAGLIEFLQQQELEKALADGQPLRKAVESKRIPLSAAQESLWVIEQVAPGGTEYNIPVSIQLHGKLDIAALNHAVNGIIQRHEILRTVYKKDPQGAYQAVMKHQNIDISAVDLSAPHIDSVKEVARRVDVNATQHFDLESDLMLRVQLFKLADEHHVLSLCVHHIASDGGSMLVLTQELSTLYTAALAGDRRQLPELQLQFKDYAHWQHQWLGSEQADAMLQFWKEKLQGLPEVHSMPLDHKRPATQSFRGRKFRQFIDLKLIAALEKIALDSSSTLFMVLHTALACLIHRYSLEKDIVIGTPIANRNHAELASMVGFFANTLVLRSLFSEHMSFQQLLEQNKKYLLAAYRNQQLPFEVLVDKIAPERSLSSNPLFQVMLVLQNHQKSEFFLPELTLTPEYLDNHTSKFDLTLLVNQLEDGYCIDWEYATDIFEPSTIQRLAGYFELILRAAVSDVGIGVDQIQLQLPNDLNQLMAWNQTESEFPTSCLHQLFEQTALSCPDAIALTDGKHSYTYRYLNSCANMIARQLQLQGVSIGDVVGLGLDRGMDLMVGLLAILKAGAAYFPIDTTLPADTIRQRVDAVEPKVILSNDNSASCFNHVAFPLTNLDRILTKECEQNSANLNIAMDSSELAYVISTSGSTGVPKLIGMPHLPLSNLIYAMIHDCPKLKGAHHVVQFASIGFDMSFTDTFLTWLQGGTLHVISKEVQTDVSSLVELINADHISVLNLPYSMIQALAHYTNTHHLMLPSVQVLISTAERLLITPEIRAFFSRHGNATLVNHYGPSETHVCTAYTLEGEVHLWPNVPFIGRPISNLKSYVVTEDLTLAPIGVVGELCVGGVGLARGYINDLELTAQKFVQDPFSVQGQRLYRTGDRVRLRENGQLEYIGRQDSQIKCRGFRIELGDIEARLLQHAHIIDGAAVYDEQHQKIACYLVADKAISLNEIKHYVKSCLPDYMHPSCYLFVDALPLNINGKVDKKLLPKPDFTSASNQEYVAAESANEKLLCQIWQDLLLNSKIGVHDNFFEIGGHSLLATRLAIEIRAAWGISFPVKAIFENQTIKEQAQILESMQSDQIPQITQRGELDRIPLSYTQQRLWLLDQIEPNSSQYNMPAVLELEGKLDFDGLGYVFNQLLSRHKTLRTVYRKDESGDAFQVILEEKEFRLDIVDLCEFDEQLQARKITELAEIEAATPFDLSQDVMLRATLLIRAKERYTLLVTIHHIASDGWSIGLLTNEASALYTSFVKGENSPLAPLTLDYADFAVWQKSWMDDASLASDLAYWKEQLKELPALHGLVLDKPRPVLPSNKAGIVRRVIDKSTTEQLHGIARAQDATLFMVLSAAFTLLLHRYSGEHDIVFGTPIANREKKELLPLVGFFVNNLVIRNKVDGELSFETLLEQCRSNLLDAYEHQKMPFDKLVDELNPVRSLSHSPLFQIMLVLQNNEEGVFDLPGIRFSPIQLNAGDAKYDLLLNIQETQRGMTLDWQYSADLFEQASIEAMASQFTEGLNSLLQGIDIPVHKLNFCPEDEYDRIETWSQQATGLMLDELFITDKFAAMAAREPSKVAVIFSNQSISYKDLEERANQLANYLKQIVQGEHRKIGLCVERGLELMVAMLAIFKAGHTYVPLDPLYPKQRLDFIVDDAGLELILSNSETLDSMELTACDVVCLDKHKDLIATQPATLIRSFLNNETLAYVIYTSGSTGNPKGVLVSHGNLAALLESSSVSFGISCNDTMAALASTSFDISILELLIALVNGGTTLLVARHVLTDLSLLLQELAPVTQLHAVPALMQEIVKLKRSNTAYENVLGKLRQLFVGGDKVSRQLLLDMKAAFPTAAIKELYGPTEATILSTFNSVTDFDSVHGKSIIGRALPHAQLYVLDQYQQPCQIGVPGELYIGGRGVTQGYLNREDQTTSRFISLNLKSGKSVRVYRSGDMVRWLPEGTLEFLGRSDNQVKVRGHRIEIGEIESCIRGFDSVSDVIVIPREANHEIVGLAAYIKTNMGLVNENTQQQWKTDLAEYIASCLPEFMRPSYLAVVPEFPLTPNGKVDVKRLVHDYSADSHDDVSPLNEVETLLAAMWSDMLDVGLEKIAATSNFFELGGHSLLCTRLVARIKEVLGIEITVKSIFETQTLRKLAGSIAKTTKSNTRPIEPVLERSKLPLSYTQQRLWLIDQIEPNSTQYNMTSSLRLKGQLDVSALQNALTEIVNRHEVLRTTYRQDHDGSLYQHIKASEPVTLNWVDLSDNLESEQALTATIAQYNQKTFDLAKDNIFQAALVKLHAELHVLIITLHHIAYDGWSMGVISTELSALYRHFREQADTQYPLPSMRVQYADYAAWQQQWLGTEALQTSQEYWLTALEGLPVVHNLPLDRARSATPTFAGDYLIRHISADNLQRINEFATRQHVTFFMVINAVYALLMHRYSGESDIAVGCPVSNREQPEVMSLVGFFANTLVLRSRFDDDLTFKELLLQSKATLLSAYEHQQMPFEKLVDTINPKRSLGHSPLFQVMIAYQNNNRVALDLPGVEAIQINHGNPQAKYDITLNIIEAEHGLELSWEYATELFDRTTIERFAIHFENLLFNAISDADRKVGELTFLDEAELQSIVYDWNETQVDFPEEKTLHQLFEEQVTRTPNNIAVSCQGDSLTYIELEELANQVANTLLAHNVSSGDFVAVCVNRSVAMVASLLGILKAGAAYVPIDPAYPFERKQKILAKANVVQVLSDCDNCQEFAQSLRVEHIAEGTASKASPAVQCDSRQTAYVIFTSGSTGEPKGVEIIHRSAVNLVTLINRKYHICEEDTILCLTSVGFDLSVYDIFGALATGSRLVVTSDGMELDARALIRLIDEHKITFWDSVPSTLNMLVEYLEVTGSNVRLPSVRLAFLSGDWIPTTLPARATNYFPQLQVIGLGGATEGTVWSNFYEIEGDVSHLASVPYGRPLDNNTFYILDQNRQPVPLGVTGELYIGGVGVAQSYLNDAEKTAASFVENPFHRDLNSTMYRTGDLGRLKPDNKGLPGEMEFLGRKDHQLKIRGFRVELGEIEHCLTQHEFVKNALVIAVQETDNLVAYVTLHQALPDALSALKQHVALHLPEYMMPSCFMVIEKIPLTANGKIDRKALPAPIFSMPDEGLIQLPENEIQESIHEIWCRLLHLERIDIHTSFFDMGGQSLLATKLVAEIIAKFGVELSIRTLFSAQSIFELSNEIKSRLPYQVMASELANMSEEELDKLINELSD